MKSMLFRRRGGSLRSLRIEVLEHRNVFSAANSGLVFEPVNARELLGITEAPVDLGGGVLFLGHAEAPLNVDTPFNRNAADTTNSDQLWQGGGLGLGLTGSGVTVGVWEAGGTTSAVLATHAELNGRVVVVNEGVTNNQPFEGDQFMYARRRTDVHSLNVRSLSRRCGHVGCGDLQAVGSGGA